MKRINNLYESIISIDNLKLADQKARKGKTKSYGVIHHDKNKEANIIALHEALKNKTYKTSAYDKFTIQVQIMLDMFFYKNQKALRKSIKYNFCNKVKKINKKELPPKEYKQIICPWLGWAKHSKSKHLLKTIIKDNYYESIL